MASDDTVRYPSPRARLRPLPVTAAIVALLGGCATVAPWEREHLARPAMESDTNPPATALDEHVFEYREGATGGRGVGAGSGCGCN